MASKRALFVENNYGYQDPFGPNSGALTTPGFARVDVTRSGCRKAWETRTERAPSVVPKLSTAAGLIYTYTRDPDPLPLGQPYFWTAIDAHTGATAFKVYAGSGLGFNNNYAGIAHRPRRHRLPRRHRRPDRSALNLHGFRPSPPHSGGTLDKRGSCAHRRDRGRGRDRRRDRRAADGRGLRGPRRPATAAPASSCATASAPISSCST